MCYNKYIIKKERSSNMTKKEFLKKWRNDYSFRRDMRMHGVRVIQDNVIFLNSKGSIESVAGAYVK